MFLYKHIWAPILDIREVAWLDCQRKEGGGGVRGMGGMGGGGRCVFNHGPAAPCNYVTTVLYTVKSSLASNWSY